MTRSQPKTRTACRMIGAIAAGSSGGSSGVCTTTATLPRTFGRSARAASPAVDLVPNLDHEPALDRQPMPGRFEVGPEEVPLELPGRKESGVRHVSPPEEVEVAVDDARGKRWRAHQLDSMSM